MMAVSRQHAVTEVTELHGRVCERLLAVVSTTTGAVTFLYALVGAVWHRFFLDAGLLFWDEGSAPDEEEDLYEGETYIDLMSTMSADREVFEEIRMADGRLTLALSGGSRLVLTERDDETFVANRYGAWSSEFERILDRLPATHR